MFDYIAATTKEADDLNLNPYIEDIRHCTRCPLSQDQGMACPGFFTEAPLDILFIGMSPGDDEAAEGRPFIGRAGQKLFKLMEEAWGRGHQIEFGFTNRVRHHTPSNRPPTGQESSACEEWLQFEIECSDPAVIVLLGGSASEIAFPGDKIGEVQGAARVMDGRIYIACYHPAALLHKYNEHTKECILTALRRAADLISLRR